MFSPINGPQKLTCVRAGRYQILEFILGIILTRCGACFPPWVVWETRGTCVVTGHVSCVCSQFVTGCNLCIWFGLCASGPTNCNLGPMGLSCLSRWRLVRQGPYGICWTCLVWLIFSASLASPCSTALLPPSPYLMLLRMENLLESDSRFLLSGLFSAPFSLAFFISVGILPLFSLRPRGHYIPSLTSLLCRLLIFAIDLSIFWAGGLVAHTFCTWCPPLHT